MKKNVKAIVTIITISFTALFISAFIAVQNLAAYETFKKTILENMPDLINFQYLENFTFAVNLNLILNNGEETVKMSIHQKQEASNISSAVESETIHGYTHTLKTWINQSRQVTKSSDEAVYRVDNNYEYQRYDNYNYSHSEPNWYHAMSSLEKRILNTIIDLAVGDIKNHFTARGNTISLILNRNQIPQPIQLLVRLWGEENYDALWSVLETEVDFTDDTTIQSFRLLVSLDDKIVISALEFSVVIIFTDYYGATHEAALEIDMAVTDIGSTIADRFDPAGKEIAEVNLVTGGTVIG